MKNAAFSPPLRPGLIYLAILFAPLPLRAGDKTWTGLGGSAAWGDAANWSGGLPSGADRAIFGSGFSSGTAIGLGGLARDAESLRIDAGTDWLLHTGTLRLATGSLVRTAASSGTQSITAALEFSTVGTSDGSPAVWDVKGAGLLSVYGSVASAGRPWQVNGGTPGSGTRPFQFGGTFDGNMAVSGAVGIANGAQAYGFTANGADVQSFGGQFTLTGGGETQIVSSVIDGVNLNLGTTSLMETGSTFRNGATLTMVPGYFGLPEVRGDGVTGLSSFAIAGSGTVRLATDNSTAVETENFSPVSGTLDLNGRTLRVRGNAASPPLIPLASAFGLYGGGGRLRVESASLRNDNATVSGLPDLTFAPGAGASTWLEGYNFNAPAGSDAAIGELRVEGPGAFRLDSSVDAERLTLAAGAHFTAHGEARTTQSVTLENGATVDGQGGYTFCRMRGGQLLNHGAALLNTPGIIVSNAAARPAVIGGTAPLTGLSVLSKYDSGSLTFDQDVQTQWLMWDNASGGTMNLNDRTLTVSGPASGDYMLTLGPANTLNGPGTLRLERATLQNSGATFTGLPSLTFAPPDGVISYLQGGAIQGPGGEARLGRLRVEGAGWFQPIATVAVRQLSVGAGPRFYAGAGVAVHEQATLENGASVYGLGGNPVLEMRGGDLRNDGASLVDSPAVSVNNTAGAPVTISGSAPLVGVGTFSKSNAGTVTLGQDVQCRALNWFNGSGTIDLGNRTFTVSGPPAGNYTQTLNSGTTLAGPGTLRLERATLQNNGATFTGLPSLTFAPPDGVISYLQGAAMQGPAGEAKLDRLRVEGAGWFQPTTAVAVRQLSVGAGPRFYAGAVVAVHEQATLENGASIYGIGGNSVLEMRGGELRNEGASFVDSPGVAVNNAVGSPVTISGSAPLAGLGTFSKAGVGELTLGTDVQARALNWFNNSGTVNLNGQTFTVTGPSAGNYSQILSFGSTLAGPGTLRLERATMQNSGATFTGLPSVTFAPPAGVLSVIQGNAIQGPASEAKWKHLRVEGAGDFQAITPVAVQEFSAAAGPRCFAGAPITVHNLATLESGAAIHGTGTNPVLSLAGGQLVNEGASFVGAPAMAVNNPAIQSVTVGGSAPFVGLGVFTKAGSGAATLEQDIAATALQFFNDGRLDLHGHALQCSNGAVLGNGSRLDDTAGSGALVLTGGTLLVYDGSLRLSTPDLTAAPPSGQTVGLEGSAFIAGGWGTLTFSGQGQTNLNTYYSADRAVFASGTTQFAAALFVQDEAVLSPGATLTSSNGSSLFLDSARLVSDGATFGGNLTISVNSFGPSVVEGSAPLFGLNGFVVSGTSSTDVRVPVSANVAVLGGSHMDLHGQTISAPNLALNGGVRVVDSDGGGGLASLFGPAVDLGEGSCAVPIVTYSGARKNGPGSTMILSATSPYFYGAVEVIAGTLAQAADLSTNASPISVSNGATYAGRGRTGGNVTLQSGAHLAPSSPGTGPTGVLTLAQSLTLGQNAVLDFDLGTPVIGSDRVVVEGGIVRPPSGVVTINIARAPGYTNDGTAYVLLDVTLAAGSGLVLSDYQLGTAPALGSLALGPGGTTLVFQPAVDSDGDGILDSWEQSHFGNLTAASATSDRDGDGTSDFLEYAGGYDPNDPNSRLELTDWLHDPYTNLSAVRFTSVPGFHYVEQSSADLENWVYWSDVIASDYLTVTPWSFDIMDLRTFRRIVPLAPEI